MTPSEPPATGHVAALDGVRGIAILVVLIHNTAFILQDTDVLATKLVMAVTATGWSGVQLFFVLSGFLITGILLEAKGSETFFRTFYLRRTLRIFPLYYAFLAITFFIVPLFADPDWTSQARSNQWWYWTYTSNWAGPFEHNVPGLSHFWSLAVEEQFYLVWPLLVFLLPRRGLTTLCAGILVLTPFIRLALRSLGLPPLAGYEFTIARWDALAAGALLAILLRDEAGRRWLAQRLELITGLALAALVALILVEQGFYERELTVQVVGQTLVAVLSVGLIYYSVVPAGAIAGAVSRAVSSRWLRFLGKYSYAIYVFHFPIHLYLMPRAGDLVNGEDGYGRLLRVGAYVAVVAVLSTAAALASWRLLEKPFLDLKDRLAPR